MDVDVDVSLAGCLTQSPSCVGVYVYVCVCVCVCVCVWAVRGQRGLGSNKRMDVLMCLCMSARRRTLEEGRRAHPPSLEG